MRRQNSGDPAGTIVSYPAATIPFCTSAPELIQTNPNMDPSLRLWYKTPATKWADCLPIGNGRLGAMPYGEVHRERWMLNENSVWYGGPTDRNPKHALKHLPKLRQLVLDGKLKGAEKLAERAFVATPASQRHYEPLGRVDLNFEHGEEEVGEYERYLDLKEGIEGVGYVVRGVKYERTVFASYPDNVIVARVETSEPGSLAFDMRVFRGGLGPDGNVYMDSIEEVDGCLVMKAKTGGNGVQLCLVASVEVEQGQFSVMPSI